MYLSGCLNLQQQAYLSTLVVSEAQRDMKDCILSADDESLERITNWLIGIRVFHRLSIVPHRPRILLFKSNKYNDHQHCPSSILRQFNNTLPDAFYTRRNIIRQCNLLQVRSCVLGEDDKSLERIANSLIEVRVFHRLFIVSLCGCQLSGSCWHVLDRKRMAKLGLEC